MKITLITVGKCKETYWRQAIQEYEKRLQKYCRLQIVELEDEKTPDKASKAEEELIKKKEGERILKAIKEDAFVITLEILGKKMSSPEFASFLEEAAIRGRSHLQLVIGGSLGLSEEVMRRSDHKLSFSDMTFPHQLMRVILLEQIYRAYRINSNEPYHK